MDWMKARPIYFVISGIFILIGIFSLLKWGFNPGIDFTGGTIVEYKVTSDIDKNLIEQNIKKEGIEVESIQINNKVYTLRLSPVSVEQRTKLREIVKQLNKESQELKFETVGPVVGPELIKKTVYALLIASTLILLWVAYQFKSIKFGASAILAMLHDSLVLLGSFALLGHLYGVQIDFLFVTAVLTILSFSVHDTIVVYDRIREFQKKTGGNIYDLANNAVSETMVRSLNNSFTIIFMLFALALLGGESIKWFAVALLIGTISGTYSSPFVAVPILVTWDELQKKIKR